MTFESVRVVCLALAASICLCPQSISTAPQPPDASETEQTPQTVEQSIRAAQAVRDATIKPTGNFYNYAILYMTQLGFRGDEYKKTMASLGIDKPAAEVPFYRHWHDYMYVELEETKAIRDQYDLLLSGRAKPDQIPQVKAWLEDNKPGLEAVARATRCGHFDIPLDADRPLLKDLRTMHYFGAQLNDVLESFRASSLYHLSLGEADAAVSDALSMDRLAKLMLCLDSNAIIEDAPREAHDNSRVLARLLTSGLLTAEHLEQTGKQMRGRMLSFEFMSQVYQEQRVPQGTKPEQYTEQIIDGMLALLLHPNRVLDALFGEAEHRTQLAFDQAMIALARYHRANAGLPDKLDALVPDYLAAVPKDPYDATRPIRYRKADQNGAVTATLQSVGINRADEQDDPSEELVLGR